MTSGGMWLAMRQADTTATEVLAGLTVGVSSLAVAVAVLGGIRALTLRPGMASTMVAGTLSVIGLILAAVTGPPKLVRFDAEGGEVRLGRSLTPADRHGVATTTLVTNQISAGEAKLEVYVAGQVCTPAAASRRRHPHRPAHL